MKILIVKTGAAGDVLRATFVPVGLKEKNPDCQIDWEVDEKWVDLLKNNPAVDNVLTSGVFYQNYDRVINLEDRRNYPNYLAEWFDMSLVSKLGKKKADKLKKNNRRTYQEIIADGLGMKPREPILVLDDSNYEFAENFALRANVKPRKPLIGVNTGAGSRWKQKKWSIKQTIALIKELQKNYQVLLLGGPDEKERNEKILEQVDVAHSGCNNSLLDFAALVNLCDVLITVDTLTLHIGTAFAKKIVALFGPTSSYEIDLFNKGVKIITPMECRCCYRKQCIREPNCMDKISVDRVYQAFRQLL